MVERCGFEEVLRECGLPEQGSNRGYRPWQLIMGLFVLDVSLWCDRKWRNVRKRPASR